MRDLAKQYPGVRFTLAGHSLGGTLAQYVSDEPNVARVYAFNAPGLPGRGRIDDKVTHYLSEKSTTRVPFTSKEFQVFGEWIEGHGERVTDGRKFRVNGIKGHGDAHMFADALSDNVGYRLREAEQRLVNGVASYSTGQKPRYPTGQVVNDALRRQGLYYDQDTLKRMYPDAF